MQKTLTKSDRKFIRLQKALIRAKFLDFKKQEELITELYRKFEKPAEAGNLKSMENMNNETNIEKIQVKSENKEQKPKKKLSSKKQSHEK